MKPGSFLIALLFASATLGAQTPSTAPGAVPATTSADVQTTGTVAERREAGEEHKAGCEEYPAGDFITPHITDAHCLEVPSFPNFWEPREIVLTRWAPIHVGGIAIDMSPTKHVVMLIIAALLCCAVLITGARSHVRHTQTKGSPSGFGSGIESMMLYIRNEVAVPNLGPHPNAYVPFILALFWFVLFANLLGLIPFGSTATGNISVTATLAIITFLVVEFAGIRSNGIGYLRTIFYWNNDLPVVMRPLMFLLMSPIEMVGKLTKPFALAIRLFANMVAGHIVVLALIGLIFAFQSYLLGLAPLAMAVGIMMLELFVAFLQAFIFSLLASVFIGQMREGHH